MRISDAIRTANPIPFAGASLNLLAVSYNHLRSQWGKALETVFDWVTVAIFAGLIVLFLERSAQEEPNDHLWQYLAASVGCAVVNYLGNEGYRIAALAALAVVLGFIIIVLKPFDRWTKS